MRRHLLCHIYPQWSGKWLETVKGLLQRWKLFDGRRVVAIATGVECDSPRLVREAFGDDPPEFIELRNVPSLREAASFRQLLERVDGEEGITLYLHGKGSTHGHDSSICHEWREVMLSVCLDHPTLVDCLLTRYPIVGPFKRYNCLTVPWHYSGSHYWFRNRDVFSRDWQRIEQLWFGVETWPGIQFASEEAGCLFCDHAGDLYDEGYWQDTVRPGFRHWQAKLHSLGKSTITPSPTGWWQKLRSRFPRPTGLVGSATAAPAN